MKLAHVSNIYKQLRCKKFIKKLILVTTGMVIFYNIAATHIRFVLSVTPSLPYRFFVIHKRIEPTLRVPSMNSYVLFYHPIVQTQVIKHVKGIPGSKLWYDDAGKLWVDEFCVGKPHTHSRTGKHVNRIQSGIIPEGYVFVYAPHDRSFDSRYEEFGLIPIQAIQGAGIAVI